MATPSAKLVAALRETAARLRSPAATYRWSHFGHCNCGHLAQTVTGMTAESVYRAAFRGAGDWGEQAAARQEDLDWGDRPGLDEGAFEPEVLRCAATGRPLDVIFGQMSTLGLDHRDFDALEDLSDGEVLRRLGASTTGLARNVRENVVAYLEAWADVMTDRLPDTERARLERAPAHLDDLLIAAEE